MNVVILNPDDPEEMALSLGGKRRKLKKDHLIDFALKLGLNKKQIDGVFERFNKSNHKVFDLIQSSFLSGGMQVLYTKVLLDRLEEIEK